MRVLHIWNTAGVAVTLAKYQRKLGVEADVIMRDCFTSFGTDKLLDNAIVIGGSAKRYALACLKNAWKYDLIHAHAFPFSAQYIHKVYRWKPFIYHLHGSWIRGMWNERKKILNRANQIVVATPELLDGAYNGVKYIPNPVDLGHFTRTIPYEKNTALYIHRWERMNPALRQVTEECKSRGLDLTISDRQTQTIPHIEFPRFLQRFEYYVDTKVYEVGQCQTIIPGEFDEGVRWNYSLSMTALQQLGMAGKVLNVDEVVTDFPVGHDPFLVADQWVRIYGAIL